MEHRKLLQHLEKRLPETLQFLQDIVGINSFTLNAAGINANAERIIEQFEPFQFSVSQPQCARPGTGCHLVLDSGGDGPAIALISHLDTVFTAEEEKENDFRWRQIGERIYGPGTMDIKGGTAIIWMMLDAFAAVDPEFFKSIRWIVLLNAAEEGLCPDFRDVCFQNLPADAKACLVFEADRAGATGDDFALLNSRKGKVTFEVEVTGHSAHAGGSYRVGANAILQMSRVVERMMAMTDLEHGETTVNVGTIEGGTVRNAVPRQVQAQVEVRSFDETQYLKIRDAFLAMNGPGDVFSPNGKHQCQIKVTQIGQNAPWPQNSETDRLISYWKKAAADCGYSMGTSPSGGLSDGNALASHFPTMDSLGPRGGKAHCSKATGENYDGQEFAVATSFVPKALINCLGVKAILENE